jgi:hypothetical protein
MEMDNESASNAWISSILGALKPVARPEPRQNHFEVEPSIRSSENRGRIAEALLPECLLGN